MAEGKGMFQNAVSTLFGGKPAGSGSPPNNPNSQPQNDRQRQEQTSRGTAATGEHTQLEVDPNPNQKVDGNGKPVAENRLDKHKDIWQPATDADGKPLPAKQKTKFSIDPAKIMEYAGKQDFKKFVKPETLAAVAKGGEEGSAAFAQAMQEIGSSTFATSMSATSQLIQKALDSQRAEIMADLPEMFKKFSLKDTLRTKHPALSHPAAAPIIEALQNTLASKHPDATAEELRSTAEDFLTSFAAEYGGKKEGEDDEVSGKGSKKPKQEDWGAFLEGQQG